MKSPFRKKIFSEKEMISGELYLRRMQLTDIPAVHAIEILTQIMPWSERIFRDCLEEGYDAWVIQRNEEIEGFIFAFIRADECHILNVCVTPHAQGQGYGHYLLEYILAYAKQRKATVALLEVRPSNRRAIHLYRKLGFNEVGIRKNYYPTPDGGREDALMFAMEINAGRD